MLAWPLLSLVAFACHLNLEETCIRIGSGDSEGYTTRSRIDKLTEFEKERRRAEELTKVWKAQIQELRAYSRRLQIKAWKAQIQELRLEVRARRLGNSIGATAKGATNNSR